MAFEPIATAGRAKTGIYQAFHRRWQPHNDADNELTTLYIDWSKARTLQESSARRRAMFCWPKARPCRRVPCDNSSRTCVACSTPLVTRSILTRVRGAVRASVGANRQRGREGVMRYDL